jgi:hypothetical protein
LEEIFGCNGSYDVSKGGSGLVKSIDIDFFNSKLNVDQKSAVKEALQAKNLYLLHGPPGTGKTETLSEMILQFASTGKRILVCSPSNIAVDTIAERLLMNNLDQLTEKCRIGHPVRILEEVREICVDSILDKKYNLGQKIDKIVKDSILNSKKLDKLKEIEEERKVYTQELFRNCQIIFSTIAGSGNNELYQCLRENDFSFDIVIIDEASQANEAETFIPILLGKKLILGGDHCQLAPVIKNQEAKTALSITLFEKLFNRSTIPKRTLNTQYRSNAKIMKFSSDYFYYSRLIPDESVRNQVALSFISKAKFNLVNVKDIFSSPLILIDTSLIQAFEDTEKTLKSKSNKGEAIIVENFILYLLSVGIQEEQIGVIAPYKAQVNLIMNKLKDKKEIEIETVDSFQGREKEIIIISTTRSNSFGEVGFLNDSRRMNVAITRAKRMLVLIGDMSTLSKDHFLNQLYIYYAKNALQINASYLLTIRKNLSLNIEAEPFIPKHLREYIVKQIDVAKERFITETKEKLNRNNKQKEDNEFYLKPKPKKTEQIDLFPSEPQGITDSPIKQKKAKLDLFPTETPSKQKKTDQIDYFPIEPKTITDTPSKQNKTKLDLFPAEPQTITDTPSKQGMKNIIKSKNNTKKWSNLDVKLQFDMTDCQVVRTWKKENVIKDKEKTAREHKRKNAIIKNQMKREYKKNFKNFNDVNDESYFELSNLKDMISEPSKTRINNNTITTTTTMTNPPQLNDSKPLKQIMSNYINNININSVKNLLK